MRKIAIFTSTLLFLLLAMEAVAEIEKVSSTVNIVMVEVNPNGVTRTFEAIETWELKNNVYSCKISTMKEIENDSKLINQIKKINDFKFENGSIKVYHKITSNTHNIPMNVLYPD